MTETEQNVETITEDIPEADWTRVIGVVIAGSISTTLTLGHYDPWSTIIGLLLLMFLTQKISIHIKVTTVYSACVSYCLIITAGFLIDIILYYYSMQDTIIFAILKEYS